MTDDDDDPSSHPLGAGLSSILRLTGFNVPTRARFVGEAMVSATMSSLTVGLVCGSIGASCFPMSIGPLVPYMIGSTIGYSFGLYQYYSTCKRNVIWYAKQYPTILAHAMLVDRHIIVPIEIIRASQQQQQQQKGSRKDPDNDNRNQDDGRAVVEATTPPTLEEWIFQGGLGRLAWSILAAQQCRNDIFAIQRQERQRVIDEILLTDSEAGDDN